MHPTDVLVKFETLLAEKVVLPQRNLWQRRAVARYLKADKNTVKLYAEEIAIVVKDYLDRCPRDSQGNIESGFALNQYQFWVVVKLIAFARLLRADMNGSAYRKELKRAAAKMQHYLSYAMWQYDSQMHGSEDVA